MNILDRHVLFLIESLRRVAVNGKAEAIFITQHQVIMTIYLADNAAECKADPEEFGQEYDCYFKEDSCDDKVFSLMSPADHTAIYFILGACGGILGTCFCFGRLIWAIND